MSSPGTTGAMHRWQGANGVWLAGDTWGDERDPLVLLLHGGGQTRHAWRGAAGALGRAGFFAVAYDARGHGDSDWDPGRDYSHDAMIEDLVRTASGFGRTAPVLVGASMGGATGLLAVGEARLEARALVLVDIAPRVEARGADAISAFMSQNPEGFASLDDVADAIAAFRPQRAGPRRLDGLTKNVRLGSDGRYRWHWDPEIYAQRSAADRDESRRRLEASARALDLPTLLLRGEFSDVVSPEGAREFLELCPRAEYVTVPGATHMVAGDQNDRFTLEVTAFLRGVDQR